MDPSFMKFLEHDEDESMHSGGTSVDTFNAALNGDIEGVLPAAAHPSDLDVAGESSDGKSSGPMQFKSQNWKEPKLKRTQHSESQRQPATQQLNNQQVSGTNDANNPMRRMGTLPTIPFHMLVPILRPNLDKDRSMQLNSAFSKLRSSEIGKEDFIRVVRNIFGDQLLRQAAHKVQLQLQSEAAENQQTSPNQYSLQAQADSQQLSSCGAQFMPHPVSAQDQKGQKSPPRQSHVPLPSNKQQ